MTDTLNTENAAAATATDTEEPRIITNDISSLEKNEELTKALSTQLQYYFSSKNLSRDTYLNTIMQLNSGFVPISILSGFANVNRIIARTTGGEINLSDLDVQQLLGTSALNSKALKIVLLDQDGKVLSSYGDDDFEAQKGALTFEAVGSCTDFIATASDQEESDEDEEKKSSTVILRDVPVNATEEDVRNVFKSEGSDSVPPSITRVEKEVGQCWFVTIDSSTSQQELVSILLSLRSKRICDEPIKARLKTQSTATQGVPMQGGGWNPYRPKYNGNNTNQLYSGDRVSYNARKFNRPYPKQRGKGSDSSGIYKGNDDGAQKAAKVKKAEPPPPLVEEHFPGLAGSPKSTAADSEGEEISNNDDNNNNYVKKEVLTNSGYAAALLKAAPQMPDVSTFVDGLQSQKTSFSKSPARKKFDDSKSTGTVSTDGSSADDKSSTSKPDFEASTAVSPVKSWSSGPSFADILKKKEAAGTD